MKTTAKHRTGKALHSMHAKLSPVIRGALDVAAPAFSMIAIRARASERAKNERSRRSMGMLAAGFVLAMAASFAGSASAPPRVSGLVVVGATPAPMPVPQTS